MENNYENTKCTGGRGCKCLSIIAIVLSAISLIFSTLCMVRMSTPRYECHMNRSIEAPWQMPDNMHGFGNNNFNAPNRNSDNDQNSRFNRPNNNWGNWGDKNNWNDWGDRNNRFQKDNKDNKDNSTKNSTKENGPTTAPEVAPPSAPPTF